MSGKKKTNLDGITAEKWLQDCLVHGEQPAKELIEEGKQQGFSLMTLRRAKERIGAGSAQRGREWYWFITTLAPIQAKPKEIKPTTDEFGYSTERPRVITTVPWMSVGKYALKLRDAQIDHPTIIKKIMDFAYPGCGFSESLIMNMLRANGVNVPNKVLDSTVQF